LPVGRSPDVAARQFHETLGSVTSCVTAQRLRASRSLPDPDQLRSVRFDEPSSLRAPSGGPGGLFLDAFLLFAIVPIGRRWQAAVRMYQYRLLDQQHAELLVYHWQPGAEFSGPDHPHIHVSATLNARTDALTTRAIDLDRRHVVTGQVSLAAVVRMLIEEFDVAPQRHDWRETLDRAEAMLQESERASEFG
jgi:hypothetical protein